MLTKINKEKFESLETTEGCVILVGAAWCGPCKTMIPMMEELEKEVFYLDADEEKELIKQFGIKSVPTILHFNGEMKRHVGTISKINLLKFLGESK